MATYRVLNPKEEVVATKGIEVEGAELGWHLEVERDGEWHFFDRSEGDRSY